ncbi:MAG: tryptophan--tRNA ligase [bacterium]|nr:tryptophan--tRNA ligase [bacterium]MDZ4248178.1 tryptophan--tRNA ligase [Patescibacteria group bacterium]
MGTNRKRVLSGVQASGNLHLGNYIGALRQFIDLQRDYDCYIFIADLHAITVPQDPKALRKQIRSVVNMHLACGLDPDKVTLFRQSDVSAHSELGWLLNTIATMGELKRMTQFKDKAGGKAEASVGVGLFDYPVLMAADILLYEADLVPTGEDQKQHIELARDLAQRFNHRFGRTFRMPKPMIPKIGARIMGLDDPSVKMSKSAASAGNRIELIDSEDVIRKKVSRAVTDSGSEIKAGPKKPAVTNLLTIMCALTDRTVAELEKEFAGKGYKEFKEALADTVVAALKPIQQTLAELEKNPKYVDEVLARGAEKARPVAERTLAAAKQAMGL